MSFNIDNITFLCYTTLLLFIKIVMKKYFQISILSVLYVLLSIFLKPEVVSASSYGPGSLIKLSNKSTIYYVASDKVKYAIPNEVTYKSWYSDFSDVNVVSTADFNSFKTSKSLVTIRPIKQLIKFPNSNKVYVIDSGAILRWLVDEETAKKYFGDTWYKIIVILPQSDFTSYNFGEDIDNNTIFSKSRASTLSSDIDAELRNRKVLATVSSSKSSLAPNSSNSETLLKYLQENLKAATQPRFSSIINNYYLNANFAEETLTLKLAAVDKNNKIFVNGTPVENATNINLSLVVGKNNYVIKVVNSTGKENTYNLEVLREKSSGNNYIKSITENLRDSISPKFDSSVKEYNIRSEYYENILKLGVQADDKKTKVYVNDQELSSGYRGTAIILLANGENKIAIRLVAENGANRYYYLTVTHYQYPKLGDNDLSSLKTSFDSRIYPAFSPKHTIYYLRLGEDEDKMQITAKTSNSRAHVTIDGSNVTSKYVSIPYGESVVSTSVELIGAPEFTKTYKIRIYRGDDVDYKFDN